MGAVPPYDSRVALGGTALAFAFAATIVGLGTPACRVGSRVLMTLAGFMGAVAMSFFYIADGAEHAACGVKQTQLVSGCRPDFSQDGWVQA
jgi:hypothetical protein